MKCCYISLSAHTFRPGVNVIQRFSSSLMLQQTIIEFLPSTMPLTYFELIFDEGKKFYNIDISHQC